MDDIFELTHRLSCELMMADVETPATVAGLLPLLKNIHFKCMKSELKPQARTLLKARQIITNILQEDTPDKPDELISLGGVIGEFTAQLHEHQEMHLTTDAEPAPEIDTVPDPEQEPEPKAAPRPQADHQLKTEAEATKNKSSKKKEPLDLLAAKVKDVKQLMAGVCYHAPEDRQNIIDILGQLAGLSDPIEPRAFHNVVEACIDYAKKVKDRTRPEYRPIEEALILLTSMAAHLKRNEPFTFDYSDVLDLLTLRFAKEAAAPPETAKIKADLLETPPSQLTIPEGITQTEKPLLSEDAAFPETIGEIATGPDQKTLAEAQAPTTPEKISDDELEILYDFISEAEDNLDAIEIRLIDLEQDPGNTDIINDIFRPFHTIKGVAGFLHLTKINRLSHTTENLLDSARSGEFIIDQTATDVILQTVDTLKELVERVKKSTATGYKEPDHDIDVDSLRERLKALQNADACGQGRRPIGEILVQKEVVNREKLKQALDTQKATPEKKLGEILVEEQNVSPGQVASALLEQAHTRRKVDTQVKVSTEKLDDLVDFAGELVIAQSMLKQKTAANANLSQNVAQLGLIVTKMQNIAMSMRMIPIKATFMKMIRLVRDLSKKSGKNVNLNMSGEDTEIDRNVVEALYEPMVHMIRNSVDHGIEPGSERTAGGKPEQGIIDLRAYHKGGHIIIEIEDDGRGLDRDRIIEKAMSTGLLTGNEQLTDGQAFELIMAPGFSTAKEITDVSGRGVGMDVVKDGIEKFRGQLNIESQKGQGTKFTISLPLTLAVIDGMLVRVDQEKYVIPTIAIQRAFKPAKDQYFTVEARGEMVEDRGDLIPLIRVDEIFDTGTGGKNVHHSLVVVVESKDEKRALLIDELLGKDEYVIKRLGPGMEEIQGLAGGAILGDGRVGLILDIHGIFSLVSGE